MVTIRATISLSFIFIFTKKNPPCRLASKNYHIENKNAPYGKNFDFAN